jgi:hypothetical protein
MAMEKKQQLGNTETDFAGWILTPCLSSKHLLMQFLIVIKVNYLTSSDPDPDTLF